MPSTIRPIRIEGNLAFITLTKGYTAIIDAADVHLAEGRNWCAAVQRYTVYAQTNESTGGESHGIFLHRVLMAPPDDMQVDHRSGDGLDCRRANMRWATRAQNNHNQRISRNNTSGFKGVSWDDDRQKWMAGIVVGGKRIHLGRFVTPEAAHAAYCEASEIYHGEFGRVA